MKINEIKSGERVVYVPLHAHGDICHPDVEIGTVSSVGPKYAHVRFDKAVAKFGWDGATSQACDPSDLMPKNYEP